MCTFYYSNHATKLSTECLFYLTNWGPAVTPLIAVGCLLVYSSMPQAIAATSDAAATSPRPPFLATRLISRPRTSLHCHTMLAPARRTGRAGVPPPATPRRWSFQLRPPHGQGRRSTALLRRPKEVELPAPPAARAGPAFHRPSPPTQGGGASSSASRTGRAGVPPPAIIIIPEKGRTKVVGEWLSRGIRTAKGESCCPCRFQRRHSPHNCPTDP